VRGAEDAADAVLPLLSALNAGAAHSAIAIDAIDMRVNDLVIIPNLVPIMTAKYSTWLGGVKS